MKKISDFNSATEKYPVIYAGSATRPEFVDMPTILQQQEGVAPMDTCPAQWWNAMWKLATRDINAFRDFVGDAFTEINNLLTKFNITLDDADSEQLYNFFHDDYVQNYLNGIFVNKTGDTIDGDLHVKGDLSVDGIGEEIISTELKVGANTITLRNDNPTALGNTELAGVVTENYDGNNHNNIIAITKDGEARTGDIDIATRILYSNDGINFYTDEDLTTPATIGATEEVRDTGNQTSGGVEIYEGITYSNNDTQPLLTREEASQLPNGIALVWDAQNKRAIGGYSAGSSAISASTTVIDNIPISNNSSIKVMFTADISDTNATGGITPLEITYNGVSIPVKASKDGALVDIFAKEVQTNIWKYLQAYTTLELVYQSDYDGQGNPAFIIVGNPILLSDTYYTIYADGLKIQNTIDDSHNLVQSQTLKIALNNKANIFHTMVAAQSVTDIQLLENRTLLIMGSWYSYGGLFAYVTRAWGGTIAVHGINGTNYVGIISIDSETIRLTNGTNETLISTIIS